MDIKKLNNQADNIRNSGQTKKAISIYRKLFTLYDRSKNFEQAGGALQMIGVCHKIDNDTDRAIEGLKQALKYFENHQDIPGQASTLRDIGITYEYQDKLQKAEKAINHSLALYGTVNDPAGYGITLAKLGLVQTRQKKYQQAEKNISESIKILHLAGHWFFEATAIGHLAGLYVEMKQFDKALSALDKSIALYEKHPDESHTRRRAQIWGLMANCFAELGEFEKAKIYLLKSLAIILSPVFSATAAAVVLRDIKAQRTVELLSSN